MCAVYSAAALCVPHLNGGALLLLKGGADYVRSPSCSNNEAMTSCCLLVLQVASVGCVMQRRLCNGSAGRHLRTLTLLVDDGGTCAGCDYKLQAVIASYKLTKVGVITMLV